MSGTTREFTLTFAGATALVTGAASGIGRATALRLLSCGIRVLAIDLRAPELAETGGVSTTPMAADVREREELEAAIAAFGEAPNYVVNCAGILDPTGFSGVSREAFSRVLDVNLVGAYQVLDVASRAGGLLAAVNITSIEATRVVALSDPDPHPAYAASKAALSMLTRSAARSLAPARVNAIAPGFVLTPMAMEHGDGETGLPPSLRPRVPLGEFAMPEQIADSIAFLLSNQAGYITGAELLVDGGFQQT